MKENDWSMRKGATVSWILAGLFLMLPLLAGCAGGNYGTLQRNYELARQFETYQVLPEYRYYFSGPEGAPLAILGVHRDYELVTGLWQPIDLTPARLRNWMDFYAPYDRLQNNYFGAYIMDPDGRMAGIWYSQRDWTVIRFPAAGKIDVYTPELNDRSERLVRLPTSFHNE